MDSNTENIELNDDRANLKSLIRLLLNNKFLILQITGIIFIIALVFANTKKKEWEGQFQIVLQSKSDKKISPMSMLADASPGILNLVNNVGMSSKDLKTQVEILKSPSVLIPTFNFVKEKSRFGAPSRFEYWRKNNLNIKLKPNTLVMDLSYKDKDKDIILPTLEKISKTYQEYALLEKSRSDETFLSFLDKQIKSYKDISDKSIKIANEYAAENKLTPFSPKTMMASKESTKVPTVDEFEEQIFNAEIKLLEVDSLIKESNVLDPKSDALLYIDSVSELKDPALLDIKKSITQLDIDISNLRSKYKEKDQTLQRAIRERNELYTNYRRQYFNKLNGLRIEAITKKNSLARPDEVLVKYSELERQASTDLNSLIMLQREREFAKIDNAQKLEPWKLITKPTLLSYPVAPNKSRIYFIGILSGLFFGSLFAYIKDKYQGVIYTNDEIEELLGIPIILSFNPQNENQSNQLTKIFAEQTSKSLGKNKLNFLDLNEFKISESEEFIIRLKKYIDKDKVLFNEDIFSESNKFENYLLITLTKINKRKIFDLKNKLSLVDKKIKGIILIDKFI